MNSTSSQLRVKPDVIEKLIGGAVTILAVYTVFYSVFGGVIRFALAQIDAMWVNNIAAVVTVVLFVASYIDALRLRRCRWFMVFFGFMIAFYATLLPTTNLTSLQIVMGFYVWMPFLLGTLVCVYEKENVLFRSMKWFWALSVIGVLVNFCIDFPWIGMSYDVAGVKMDIARSWSAEGYERLPGFSRLSISAACLILVSYAVLMVSRQASMLFKLVGYVVSCVAIGLTTSKAELGLILLLPFVFAIYRALQSYRPNTELGFHFARAVIAGMVALVICLPVLTSTHHAMRMNGPLFGFLSGDTMIERMTHMWPDAFDMVERDGNPVTGRGIGGIGTALQMHRPVSDLTNTADNQFVYLYVEAGLLAALPFFWGFVRNLGYLYRCDRDYFEKIFVLSLCVLGISVSIAPIEEVPVALIAGILVARGYMKFREDVRAPR